MLLPMRATTRVATDWMCSASIIVHCILIEKTGKQFIHWLILFQSTAYADRDCTKVSYLHLYLGVELFHFSSFLVLFLILFRLKRFKSIKSSSQITCCRRGAWLAVDVSIIYMINLPFQHRYRSTQLIKIRIVYFLKNCLVFQIDIGSRKFIIYIYIFGKSYG